MTDHLYGHFVGDPITRWLINPDGEDLAMELLSDFRFIAPDGVTWEAPVGSIIDGASIPRALWSVVGSPYVGNYRRATIVHDVACQRAKETRDSELRRAGDKMFYWACLASGCDEAQASILYLGVRVGAVWPAVDPSEFTILQRRVRRVLEHPSMPRRQGDPAQVETATDIVLPRILEMEELPGHPLR